MREKSPRLGIVDSVERMARLGISNRPWEVPILYILKGLLSNYTTVEKILLLRGALRFFYQFVAIAVKSDVCPQEKWT